MRFPISPHRRSVLFALAALLLWSSLATLSLELKHIPPFFLLGSTLMLGGLAGIRFVVWREIRPGTLLLGVYGLFAYHLCLFLALRRAPAVEANLLNYLWPLFIVLLAPLFIKKITWNKRFVLGAALGFLGVVLLLGRSFSSLSVEYLSGYVLAILAAFIWATYSLLTARLGNFPTFAVSVFCLTAGGLALLCHAAFEPRFFPAAQDFWPLLFVGLGPMGAAFYLWDKAMKDGDPRIIGTLSYLTPLFSTSFLVASGQGQITKLSALAALLIVSGAIVGAGRR